MTCIAFTVPGQPQGKARARVGMINGHARMFTPAKTAAYEGLIATVAQQAMRDRELFEGPCSISLDVVLQIPASWSKRKQAMAEAGSIKPTTKPDVDNVLKAVGDGCNGVVWRDDSQVVQVTMAKRYGVKPGVTVVIAYAYPGMYSPQQEEVEA